tara:strand:+ start:160 stop:462 length:303 start_codon:yes stop_codon:yes gene_type:complete
MVLDVSEQKTSWFVYLIKTAAGQLYTGISTDVERRFHEHQSGGKRAAKFLRGKGPLRLVFFTEVADRAAASRLEYQIKQLKAAQKERLVAGDIEPSELIA